MKIAKALKQKNVLIKEINRLKKLIADNNQYVEPNKPKFDVIDLNYEFLMKLSELISLKEKIAKANISINEKIYKMAELKGIASFYSILPCEDYVKYDINRNETVTKSIISKVELDSKIKEIEKEIQDLQDEIDYFNQTTDI